MSANTLLPLMQLEGAQEDMDRFLEERLQAVCASSGNQSVVGGRGGMTHKPSE